MNKIILTVILSFIIACNTDPKSEKNTSILPNKTFELTGKLSNFYTDKVYLNKFINNAYFPIDSSVIDKNTFSFTGSVEYPERFVLTFNNYTAEVMLIVENCIFNIEINQLQINDPKISGSILNLQLNHYQMTSRNIFNKIDHLFPQFQNARLENNVNKLKEIRNEMNKIESKFTEFSIEFIKKNINSYISPMILRDLIKTPDMDSLKTGNLYYKFPDSIKESADSKIIAKYLNLP